MKSAYFKYVACVIAFLAIGLYDVHDNFKGYTGFMALLLLLLVTFFLSGASGRLFVSWKLFFAGLSGFFLSTYIGSLFNPAVERAASAVVASIYDYKKQTGVYPESLMQVATAGNIKDLSRKRIKYGARVHYMRMKDGFHLSYDTYAFNGQVWDTEKKAFVEIMD
ncbi:hypothetical protein INH39_27835 [Massilia violaceinigra]|uniref:Uncharacterized protein n=1 Tax=Massilia violaceinigra TaxID=2045208 RepID=A0ABY4A3H1_9BURK|nr:hypothetical protein [Massilia violaceinigra]UOD29187.1 hypothetical protein INH39_27835 [Massilia violaceinigra]